MRILPIILLFGIAAALCSPPVLRGDPTTQPIQGSWLSPQDLSTIGIDQRLGHQIPAGLHFIDSEGHPVGLDSLLARKPSILALVYYDCPNLCTVVLNGLVLSLADLRRDVGEGFQIVVVSIDPAEKPDVAAKKKAMYLRRYSRSPATSQDWQFLTGDSANIAKLARAVGYRYRYDPVIHQFAHGSGVMVVDQQRRLIKYFLGIEYPPAEMDKAIQMAGRGAVGSPVQNFLLLCYCYNPLTGPYGWLVFDALKIGAGLTVLALAAYIFIQLQRERRAAP